MDRLELAGLLQHLVLFADPPHTKIDDISSDDFRQLLDLNLVSYFLVAKVNDHIIYSIVCY